MNINEVIIEYTRRILGDLTITDLPDADAIAFLNDAWMYFQLKLAKEREDFFVMEASLLNMMKDKNRYAFPDDMLIAKRVEINYTDPTDLNLFIKADEVDVANLPSGQSWDFVKRNQSQSNPLFDHRGSWFEIAPIPDRNLTKAIKVYYLQRADILDNIGSPKKRFTLITDQVPYPISFYPEIMSYKMASIYMKKTGTTRVSQSKSVEFEAEYLKRFELILEGMSPKGQSTYQTKSIPWTGYEF